MGKLFGTDGIRGIANVDLTTKLAYRIGQAAAVAFQEVAGEKNCFVMGQDTRISSDMLAGALIAGLCACGADVLYLGVIPTPAVAYLTVRNGATAGIVVSASHNSYEYNGIKFFSGEGCKVSDAVELRMEELILSAEELPVKTGGEIGKVIPGVEKTADYIDRLVETVPGGLCGRRVLIDCANGAASVTAQKLFSHFALDVDFLHHQPNGTNINDRCGSTHMEILSERVVAGGYDLGIAFDGDADRCLAIDEKGHKVDGDLIMAVCAEDMAAKGTLTGGGFVATIMSNIGLRRFGEDRGFRVLPAQVGDRNVLEMMKKEGMRLGGEQSGHIIFLEYMPTGDGELAALQLLRILCEKRRPLSELCAQVVQYPQTQINVPWQKDKETKKQVTELPEVAAAIRCSEERLGSTGRVLVRPSGTEAIVRVLVEAENAELAENEATLLSDCIEKVQKNL